MKKYIFDGHKLAYHPERVNAFSKNGDCYPLYMEISPVGKCSHRCIFCAYDFIGYPDRRLESERMMKFIDEIAECGIKSVLYAGEGEPLLHPDIDKLITRTRRRGIDVGMFTNGQLLKKEVAEEILPSLTFVRFSFNGGTDENYSKIHRVKPAVFDTVVANVERTADFKKKNNLTLDIGIQYVLLPENIDFLINAVRTMKKAGVDYFVIKPFVKQSCRQSYIMEKSLGLNEIDKIFNEAENLSTKEFRVVARREAFQKYGEKNYIHCYGTSFISVLNSAGNIGSCLPYWDKDEFIYGNIYENSFREIWLGERRKQIKYYIENGLHTINCPPNCRANLINEFLWELKNPTVKHVNFI
jgi:MoaA/NifB/PqqE/SkfB family radical SAM enzyme